MWIDTHCHLDFKDFDEDRDAVIERAFSVGVEKIINPGASVQSSQNAVSLSLRYKNVYSSVGIHPSDADVLMPSNFKIIETLAKSAKTVAIGETGLDYYRNSVHKQAQADSFQAHIDIAQHLSLPLIIHIRDAFRDAIPLLSRNPINGVVHCFSGSIDDAKKILDMGFYISFTGNITYPKAGALRDVVSYVPVERIMVETDAPFLAPQIIRGQRNQPCHCVDIGEAIACIKGLSIYDVERITTLNAIHLFGIGKVGLKGSIAYPIRDSLYLNITNRCTNSCSFCIRNKTGMVKGHFLKLEKEPDFEEIISVIGDPIKYREVVFCGFGEPTLRLDIVLRVAGWLKEKGVEVRLNTNGHASLIAGRDVVPDMVGKIDRVSVSLDAHNTDAYNRICNPVFGEHTFEGVLQFAKRCKDLGIIVEFTVVRVSGVDIQKCKKIALGIGADFRVREYDEVG